MLLENLLRMPHSHVTQLLEGLQKDKLPPHLLQRMRLDPEFRQAAVHMLTTKYRDDPGEKFTIEVDRSQSRLQLNTEIQQRNPVTLRNEIIEGLQPKMVFPEAGRRYLFKEAKPVETMDVWLIPLWQDTIEKEAISLLDAMGYESVQTEEALTFALQRGWGYDDWIVVLAAKCRNLKFEALGKPCTTSGLLSFGRNGFGESMLSLHDFEDFSAKVKFLVKKKQPKPQVEET